ncbi:MAG: hypothetical protein IIC71_04355 [Acidobacteria bacterium]|nr:hypothetical protein [Acidobacteriota bacterium]
MKKIVLAVLVGVLATVLVGPASASVTQGDCAGSATILGVTYTPDNDTPGNPILLPNRDGVVIPYEGGVGFVNTNHSGEIGVTVAGINIKVDDWAGTNEDDDRQTMSEYRLDEFYQLLDDRVPGGRVPGLWRLWVTHNADGGNCTAFALVKIEGNPLATPLGAAVLIMTVIALGLMFRSLYVKVISKTVKHRIALGVIAGLFLGLGIGILTFMYGFRTLDTTVVFIFPLIAAIVGFLLAKWGPMGRPVNL